MKSKSVQQIKVKRSKMYWFGIGAILFWEVVMLVVVIISRVNGNDMNFLLGLSGMLLGLIMLQSRRIRDIEEFLKG